MALSDWTEWEVLGSSVLVRYDIIRTAGNIYYFTNNNKIYQLDEDTQYGATLLTTLPTPSGVSPMVGTRLYYPGNGPNFWCLCLGYQGAWASYPIVFRYNFITDSTTKVLDVYDQTGFTHSYDSIYGAAWEWNQLGLVIPCTEFDSSEHTGNRGLLICSYDGNNWFTGYHDAINDASANSMASLYPEAYRMVQRRTSGAGYIKYATTNFYTWGDWTPTPKGNKKLGTGLLGTDAGNPDQWLFTDNGWASYGDFRDDTGLTGLNKVSVGEGRFWTSANNGLAYWDIDTDAWEIDYPNGVQSGRNISNLFEGYTGHLFLCEYWSSVGYIQKRDRLGGGVRSGLGIGSNKLSIDRNSNHVYCTTYGIDTRATDYWRVASDLSEVLLIDQSTVSGVYGGVHSQEEAGVLCYGNIDGDLVKNSLDSGLSFTFYGVPSGLEFSAIEASTVYTKRDNLIPEDVLITVTVSGLDNDLVYAYSGGWYFRSSGYMIAESQVRRDEHTFIGALLPASGTDIVDYSDTVGVSWEAREYGLPTITITDLEFA